MPVHSTTSCFVDGVHRNDPERPSSTSRPAKLDGVRPFAASAPPWPPLEVSAI